MSRGHRSKACQPVSWRSAVFATSSVVAVAAALALAAPASADPVNQKTQTLTIACAGGGTYVATGLDLFTGAQDHPRWVAHDVDSNAVFVPTHFGDVHVEVTSLTDGSLVFSEDSSFDIDKGHAGSAVDGVMDCTATFSEAEEIPGFGDVLVSGSEELQGYTTSLVGGPR